MLPQFLNADEEEDGIEVKRPGIKPDGKLRYQIAPAFIELKVQGAGVMTGSMLP